MPGGAPQGLKGHDVNTCFTSGEPVQRFFAGQQSDGQSTSNFARPRAPPTQSGSTWRNTRGPVSRSPSLAIGQS